MISKGSILIVDDDVDSRKSLCMILSPSYDVHTAKNGQEAIDFLSQKQVDLITLELLMPGLSGIDLLKEIKKLQPHIEVIIVTGYETLSNAQEAAYYGAVDFISKPFNVADIIMGVSKALGQRSQNKKIEGLIEQFRNLCSSRGLKRRKDLSYDAYFSFKGFPNPTRLDLSCGILYNPMRNN